MDRYSRDLEGYGQAPPQPNWPGGAHIAVQIALYLDVSPDDCSGPDEQASAVSPVYRGSENWRSDATAEYGTRAGFWRLYRLLTQAAIPVTVFGAASTYARTPHLVDAALSAGWELGAEFPVNSDTASRAEASLRSQLQDLISRHTQMTGNETLGLVTAHSARGINRLAAETGTFKYVRTGCTDDLPYQERFGIADQLMIPEIMNSADFGTLCHSKGPAPFAFGALLLDSFETLLDEGRAGQPKLLTIGIHSGQIGHPALIRGLSGFLKSVQTQKDVWIATCAEIADHWAAQHPATTPQLVPSALTGKGFVDLFGDVFAHSPWVAEQAWEGELGPSNDTALGLHSALIRRFRAATHDQRLAVLRANSINPVTCLPRKPTEKTRTQLDNLCAQYQGKNGFPYATAVPPTSAKSLGQDIKRALDADPKSEFSRACREIELLARQKIDAIYAQHLS